MLNEATGKYEEVQDERLADNVGISVPIGNELFVFEEKDGAVYPSKYINISDKERFTKTDLEPLPHHLTVFIICKSANNEKIFLIGG